MEVDSRKERTAAGPALTTLGSLTAARSIAILVGGAALIAIGWAALWSGDRFWNPLAFTALWTGVAVFAWSTSAGGYPGIRRHVVLAAISVPCWWWFELVNARVQNWQYVYTFDYSGTAYAVLSTIAFATVVPAVVSVSSAVRWRRALTPEPSHWVKVNGVAAVTLVIAGIVAQLAVFALPSPMFPLVWVAPFLVADGLAARFASRSIVLQLMSRQWRDALVIASAGLMCGVLWEFWNFWSTPHWEYQLPALDFAKVFEMPLLGYGGYIPFAWFVVQLVRVVDRLTAGTIDSGIAGDK